MPYKPCVSIGEKHGTRTIIKLLPKRSGSNAIRCLVRCECGNEREVYGYALLKGSGCGSCSTKKPYTAPKSYKCGTLRSYINGCRCSLCRSSNAKNAAEYRKTPKGQKIIKNSNLKKYGITVDEYESMHDAQNGLCAICKKPETKTNQYGKIRLAVDHCHESGKNRGLLCMNCNRALGLVGEDLKTIQAMYEYIKNNENKK
jgi:hypothetical protein